MGDAGGSGTVEVHFTRERDFKKWEIRNEAGEVPGGWPYGLDALRSFTSLDVKASGLAEPRRVDRLLAPLRSALGRRTGTGRDVGLAWDENVAYRMVSGRPHDEMYSGAIWITDAVAASGAMDPATRAQRAALMRMSGVFVLSKAQLGPLAEILGKKGPVVEYVRFGVDNHFYSYSPYPDRPLVVSVGGDRDRDAATLFDALARIRSARPDAEMIVQTTSALAPPEGVTTVRYFTHLQLRDLYSRASVVAIATRPNLHASGMTVSLEAMATGRPVVITGSPGLEDYVSDGVTGYVVPTGSAAQLSDRVLHLLNDSNTAATMGRAARADVDGRLSGDHLVSRLAEFMRLS